MPKFVKEHRNLYYSFMYTEIQVIFNSKKNFSEKLFEDRLMKWFDERRNHISN